jgi:hypothetical protein
MPVGEFGIVVGGVVDGGVFDGGVFGGGMVCGGVGMLMVGVLMFGMLGRIIIMRCACAFGADSASVMAATNPAAAVGFQSLFMIGLQWGIERESSRRRFESDSLPRAAARLYQYLPSRREFIPEM